MTSAVLLVPEWYSVDDLPKSNGFLVGRASWLFEGPLQIISLNYEGTNSGTHSQDIRQLINNHSIHKYFMRIGHVSGPPGYHMELKEM